MAARIRERTTDGRTTASSTRGAVQGKVAVSPARKSRWASTPGPRLGKDGPLCGPRNGVQGRRSVVTPLLEALQRAVEPFRSAQVLLQRPQERQGDEDAVAQLGLYSPQVSEAQVARPDSLE